MSAPAVSLARLVAMVDRDRANGASADGLLAILVDRFDGSVKFVGCQVFLSVGGVFAGSRSGPERLLTAWLATARHRMGAGEAQAA